MLSQWSVKQSQGKDLHRRRHSRGRSQPGSSCVDKPLACSSIVTSRITTKHPLMKSGEAHDRPGRLASGVRAGSWVGYGRSSLSEPSAGPPTYRTSSFSALSLPSCLSESTTLLHQDTSKCKPRSLPSLWLRGLHSSKRSHSAWLAGAQLLLNSNKNSSR